MNTYANVTNKKPITNSRDLWNEVWDWENYALVAVVLCAVVTMATALVSITV